MYDWLQQSLHFLSCDYNLFNLLKCCYSHSFWAKALTEFCSYLDRKAGLTKLLFRVLTSTKSWEIMVKPEMLDSCNALTRLASSSSSALDSDLLVSLMRIPSSSFLSRSDLGVNSFIMARNCLTCLGFLGSSWSWSPPPFPPSFPPSFLSSNSLSLVLW